MPDDAPDKVGDVLDQRYVIRRLIAETGLGVVYEARHRYTDRTVAIKRTRAGLASAPRVRERLLREARFLGGARHPGIVAVLDAGESPEGSPYMVMEMLEGRTLDGLLATRGALSVEEAVRIGAGVCEALAYAHAQGVVHRDMTAQRVRGLGPLAAPSGPRSGSGAWGRLRPHRELMDFHGGERDRRG